MAALKQKLSGLFLLDLKRGDVVMLAVVGAIIIFGLIMLSSATTPYAFERFGNPYYFFKKQLVGLAAGLVAFFFCARIHYHLWKKLSPLMLLISIVLLTLVFIPSFSADWGASKSWVAIPGIPDFQPSELVKLTFLMYLAAWLEKRRDKSGKIQSGAPPFFFVLGVIIFLMLLQPDVGTLSIIVATSLMVYFVGGGRKIHIIAVILIGAIGLFGLLEINDYQKDRIRCFINPAYDPIRKCYQLNQSLIAVGSGGIWGRGLGQSRQKSLYLPEVAGDSIFPIIAEELGFIASSLLIFAFVFLFYRGWKIGREADDDYGKILSIGIVSWFTFQALLNIGGAIKAIPMTGVPLPLVSYGGSSLVAALAAIGILYNISVNGRSGSIR